MSLESEEKQLKVGDKLSWNGEEVLAFAEGGGAFIGTTDHGRTMGAYFATPKKLTYWASRVGKVYP